MLRGTSTKGSQGIPNNLPYRLFTSVDFDHHFRHASLRAAALANTVYLERRDPRVFFQNIPEKSWFGKSIGHAALFTERGTR